MLNGPLKNNENWKFSLIYNPTGRSGQDGKRGHVQGKCERFVTRPNADRQRKLPKIKFI